MLLSPASTASSVPRRRVRRCLGLLALVTGLLLLALSTALADNAGPVVDIVEVDGVIDRTMAGHVVDVLAKADADAVALVVVEIDSPGALGGSADRIVEAIEASDVPVVVWVGPPGAWAVGGALAIAQAGDVLAAAPGTLLGPAGSLDLGRDATAGAGDLLAGLAAERGRDGDEARAFADGVVVAVAPGDPDASLPQDARLPDGVARTGVDVRPAPELVDAGVLDLAVGSLPDLLAGLEGHEIAAGEILAVGTTGNVRFNNLGLARQVLHAATSPILVYVLLVGGALALVFEVFQPGFGVAGVAGFGLLALGAYGLVVLPTSVVGMVLATVGLLFLAADLALGRLGLLSAAGAVGFTVGSGLLFTGPPLLDVPHWLIGLATVVNLVFFVGVMTTVLRAQGNQALAGAEDVVGQTGVVRSMLNPEGHIFVGGVLWRARAPEAAGKVKTGTPVRVMGLNDRLTLEVEPIDADAGERTREPSPTH